MLRSFRIFISVFVPLATAAVLLTALATSAAAKNARVNITQPKAGSTVSGDVNVQTKVRPLKARHTIAYYVDGRLVKTQRGGAVASTRRNAVLDTTGLKRGRHTIRVVVKTRNSKRAQSKVRVRVDNGQSAATSDAKGGVPAAKGEQVLPNDPNIPNGNANGFQLIFADDFTKDAALGSWGSECDADKILYTGTSGTKWRAYPKCYRDTYQKRPYRSDQVLSVKDGNLNFWLHNVDGQPAGANPSPVISGNSQYQTYGRYSARVKVEGGDMSEYYMAWLLWPQDESKWSSAESDYPEGPLAAGRNGVHGYHHYSAGNDQEAFDDGSVDMHEWHTYTQDWTPLVRKYYVDGRLIHTTIKPVFSGPERWQLQTETNGFGNSSGHLLVDWVAVYGYAPGMTAN